MKKEKQQEKQQYNFELSPEDIDQRDEFSEKWCGYDYTLSRLNKLKSWDSPMSYQERCNLGIENTIFETVDVEVD
jgi:hypothetical protein|tara:strand:+ start:756 stop:980 length:225 start_codon:yes stop_codon:yes gene_type:complete